MTMISPRWHDLSANVRQARSHWAFSREFSLSQEEWAKMDRSEIEHRLKARPFEPFTIHTDDGDLIGVKSPEFAWLPPVGNRLLIAMEMGDGGATRIISLSHIAQLTVGPDVETRFPSSER